MPFDAVFGKKALSLYSNFNETVKAMLFGLYNPFSEIQNIETSLY